MKLQNLSVIFVIIAIPIILISSYYISLQIDTINMQTSYNTKLLESTKEAIDAFEINTVEWNPHYSEVKDSKRRAVMASVNTFTSSFANNTGVAGRSKEYILSYIPALAYTLYDGYYIYSPGEAGVTITNDDGVTVTLKKGLTETGTITNYSYNSEDEGKILYKPKDESDSDGIYNGIKFTLDPNKADTEYKHILKPFSSYSEIIEIDSEKVEDGMSNEVVINYTLDNYVTIYGILEDTNEDDKYDAYVSKAGYLTALDRFSGITNNTIAGLEFNLQGIEPEILSEQVAYKNSDGVIVVETFKYVYESDNNIKLYYDDEYLDDELNKTPEFFMINSDLEKEYIKNTPSTYYKKCTILFGGKSYREFYQCLNGEDKGNWYRKDPSSKELEEITDVNRLKKYLNSTKTTVTEINEETLPLDYSAVNYCVESYVFTNWVQSLNKTLGTGVLFDTVVNDPENENSPFSSHRRKVIKESVTSNLNQAITSYSRNSEGEYQLPVLSETDWDQVLRNVSIITFVQGIPIGMKYYNNYAIATSTVNKEYVDPDEIYLNASGDEYYHMPYCSKLESPVNLIGYRCIDYIQKSYKDENDKNTHYYLCNKDGFLDEKEYNDDKTIYYYLHDNNGNIDVEQACYYCQVQKSLYEEAKTDFKEKAYWTALARERYKARMSKLPPEVEPTYWVGVYRYSDDTTAGEFNNKIGSSLQAIYSIKKNGEELLPEGNKSSDKEYKIPKNETPTYQIDAINNNSNPIIENEKTGTVQDVEKFEEYESNSTATISVNRYDEDGLGFSILEQNCEIGTSDEPEKFEPRLTELSSDYVNGYINVKLKYKSIYTSGTGTVIIDSANIDEKNKITLKIIIKGIEGRVRLKFINGFNTLYSVEDCNVSPGGTTVYYKINGNTAWYNDDWQVEVIGKRGAALATSSNVYSYTINSATSLKGFAEATNEGAKSYFEAGDSATDSENARQRIFELMNDISSVAMQPIAGKSGNTWFDGYFKGNSHIISGMNITPTSSESDYVTFGLFGNIGKKAKVENLTIQNATIDLKNIYTTNKNYKSGVIAGFCDESAMINNVTVSGTNKVKGTHYVGGLYGEIKQNIKDKNLSNITVQSYGNTATDESYIYVGGIVGCTENKIKNCTLTNSTVGTDIKQWKSSNKIGELYIGGIVGKTDEELNNVKIENSTIGSGNVSINSKIDVSISNWKLEYGTDKYYVGGIVGHTSSSITNPQVSDNSIIKGGAINNSHSSETREEYTGGVAGYYSGNIDAMFQTNCTVSGHDNVGGIIGFSNGGSISNLNHTGTLSGTGENIGGIVGCKNSGEIRDCNNNTAITGSGKNVGGIVGCNSNANIINCINNANVTGNANVGGIAGITYNGWIYFCKNKNTINGIENTNGNISEDAKIFYAISSDNVTGTGGIVGKNYNAKISCSYNDKQVTCNFNGGGIAGINYGGTIEYCYNSRKSYK